MISFVANLLTGIGLSMDAFSLAIIYGTLGFSKKKMKDTALTVGIYHFVMPLLGYLLGNFVLTKLIPDGKLLVGLILLVIAVEMLWSLRKDEKPEMLTGIVSILLFGLTVSIDSFSVGIGFGTMHENIWVSAVIFSLVSALFTYIGLTIGKRLSDRFGKFAIIFGSILLLGLSLSYFFGNL